MLPAVLTFLFLQTTQGQMMLGKSSYKIQMKKKGHCFLKTLKHIQKSESGFYNEPQNTMKFALHHGDFRYCFT